MQVPLVWLLVLQLVQNFRGTGPVLLLLRLHLLQPQIEHDDSHVQVLILYLLLRPLARLGMGQSRTQRGLLCSRRVRWSVCRNETRRAHPPAPRWQCQERCRSHNNHRATVVQLLIIDIIFIHSFSFFLLFYFTSYPSAQTRTAAVMHG